MEPWLELFARANFRRSADTAHDLKTPLNVAVLNLELLRMRLRKLEVENDEKIAAYSSAIETELRRMGHIFDAFFLLSTPPKNDEAPAAVDIAPLVAEAASQAGFGVEQASGLPLSLRAHEPRIRETLKLFFDGASHLFVSEDRRANAARENNDYIVTITGTPAAPEAELMKLFKFYYSDAQGNPDLSLAVARLIAETYGGELNAVEAESGKVLLRLSFPLGER